MKLCLGTVQFGLNYGVHENEKLNTEEVMSILGKATANGVLNFDTAAAYGCAEEILGNFVVSKSPTDLKVVSKLRPDALSSSNDYAYVMLRELTESLYRLGLERLEGYMFHNASWIYDKRAVEALTNLKRMDLVDKVGVSVYKAEDAMKALEYNSIDIVQIPYNVLDHRLDKASFFKRARDRGVIVYARSVLLQGLLTMTEETVPEYMAFALPTLRRYWDVCRSCGLSAFQAAVQYVLSKRDIDYLVFGVDNEDQLFEYVNMKPLNDDGFLRALDDEFSNVEERLLMPNLWR